MNEQRSGGIIPPHGGYRDLKSYQMAEIVYDATVAFCDRFISKRSRTRPTTCSTSCCARSSARS